ncbi:MAG: Rrf2 family transcriptional regulator [Anaerolineales bacterium]|nr:Rrf2 family transcriptional regulator [Anaerolineales bacterium]
MFRINRRTDYAVRVMLCLAKRPPGARLPTQMIQDEMLIPRAFLQRIIADLSRAGLLHTFPGPSGGLELARPAGTINLWQIWEAAEGPLLISDCLEFPEECPLESACPVRLRWGRLQSLVVRELEATSLEQLALEANQAVSMIALHKVAGALAAPAE